MTTPATLHMICGKVAAGKSTLAARLADAPNTVRLSEDDWLGPLFGDQIKTPADYVTAAGKLRRVIGPHIANLLNTGLSVVLDFPANTVETRVWMRSILDQTDANHQMHVLAPSDEVCLARLHARNASGTHPFQVTDEQFHQISKHFAPPTAAEGFTLVMYENGP